MSSISTPASYAQSVGIPDLPFLNFNGDISNKENNDIKDLYDMIPGLGKNEKSDTDTTNSDASTGNEGSQEKVNESTNNDKGMTTSMTQGNILGSILDKLPYSDVLSDTLSSSSSPSLSESQMGEVIPGQYIVVLNDDAFNLREILTNVAGQVNIEGTEILHIYDDVINGFAISVPNERIINVLEQSPFVDFIEKDKVVKAFAQTLSSGVNRVDGD